MNRLHDKETNKLVQAIHEHIDNFVEEDDLIVFHQEDDDFPHVDIYWIKANHEYRPFTILLTGGLSANPMAVPDDEYDRYLEVAMLLPGEWLLGEAANNQKEFDWPIHHLRSIAKRHIFQKHGLGRVILLRIVLTRTNVFLVQTSIQQCWLSL